MKRNFGFPLRARLMASVVVAFASQVITVSANVIQPIQYGVGDGPIVLSNLVNTGNTILVGDKVFSNFTYSSTGDMPDTSHVNITPEIVTQNNQTLWGFQVEGLFTDSNAPGGSDAVLNYTVTVIDPNFLISDAHLIGDVDVVGSGFVKVTETWTPNSGSQKVRVYDIEPGGVTQVVDSISFDSPVESLNVTKNIAASIPDGSTGNNATVTSIDQLYSQVPNGGGNPPSPEPASLSLCAIGAGSLLFRRRKHA